jgi:SAM-dependent methyltransferase
MDKYQKTIETFNTVAEQYWDKFKDFALYEPTYDWFCAHLPDGQIEVLEIACGPGHVSRYLLNKNPTIKLLGIDLAPNMVKLAQRHNSKAAFQIMDCRNILALAQSFAAIMCGFCLPYLSWQDSQKLIDDMCQLIKPGGLLYISVTEGESSQQGFQGSDSARGSVYVHYHDIEAIQDKLKVAGMEILGTKHLSHIHNQQTTKDVFILARKPD